MPVLATLALSFLQATPPPADVPLAWKDLVERPERWLGRSVRVVAQYHSRVEAWNPYLTRFGPGQFSAHQLWSDEQLPWVVAEHASPAVRLFTRRGAASEWALAEARAYERFELTLSVRELFLGLPWCEVTEVLPLAESIPEGTVIHAAKALRLIESRAHSLARSELDQALVPGLPLRARNELERLREACRRAGEPAAKGARASR